MKREAQELDLGDWAHAVDSEADGGADDARLREGCIHHAVRSKTVQQPIGGAEDAAVAPNILAQYQHPIILGQGHAQRTGECITCTGCIDHLHRDARNVFSRAVLMDNESAIAAAAKIGALSRRNGMAGDAIATGISTLL